jgi:Ser/Thr protein kinase RdoA (MazF antagonist)
MGVKTVITLRELNSLFPTYKFTKIIPTIPGIIDTTYIIHTKDAQYILKKYERDIGHKIALDIKLLDAIKSGGLNVPLFLDNNADWFIYEKLEGEHIKSVRSYHIQALARFMAQMHKETAKLEDAKGLMVEDEVSLSLKYVKANFFGNNKKFESLKYITHNHDAIIHGDIFKDNTIFNNSKIGVFDFIDSSYGSFTYDAAVALVGFDVRERHEYFINLFLINYNQKAPKKLKKSELIKNMKTAANFFALKRVYEYKNTSKVKELLK